MPQTKASILVKNTKWIYISKLFSQLFGLLATILVIRQLEVSVFGAYNLLLSSFVVFEILALSAVSNVFNRYIPELIANKEHHKLNRFIKGGIVYSFLLFSALVLTLYFLRDSFSSFFNIEDFDKYLIAFFIFIYANFLQIISGVVLKALLLHKKTAIVTIFSNAIRLIFYIYFAQRLDVNLLLYIESFIGLFFLITSVFIYLAIKNKFVQQKPDNNITPVTFKRVKRYGLLSMVNELGVGIVGKTSDYFIVAAMSSPLQVGLFAFAHRIYGIVFKILPFNDIQTVIRPLFFQKYSKEYDIKEFQKMYSFMIKLLLPIYIFPAIYFFFFGRSIISIVFDPKYIDAYWITIIVLLSNVFLAFFFPLALTVQLKERMDILFYSKIVAVFSIIAGILGMKYFGVLGVAIASLIGNLLKNLFIVFFMRDYPEIRFNYKDFLNFLFIGFLLMPFALLQPIVISGYLIIILTLFFIIYIAFLTIIFSPFNDYDKQILQKIVSSNSLLMKIYIFVVKLSTLLPSLANNKRKRL